MMRRIPFTAYVAAFFMAYVVGLLGTMMAGTSLAASRNQAPAEHAPIKAPAPPRAPATPLLIEC